MTNVIVIFHFRLFFALYPPPPPPPNSWKNKKFKKNEKKKTEDIIILHNCTISDDHRLYCSWDMAHGRCNYFSFSTIFCPFTLLPARKTKISKKMKKKTKKKPWRNHYFTQVYQNSWSYATMFLRYGTWDVIIFHFGLFFALLPS